MYPLPPGRDTHMYTALLTYSYGFVAVAVGVIFLKELGHAALSSCRPKTVGPSYWGVYAGASLQEPKAMKTVRLPKEEEEYGVLAGSTKYSKGKAVKTLRS
jgi:hypothetical protein